jgi:hypothetical protein
MLSPAIAPGLRPLVLLRTEARRTHGRLVPRLLYMVFATLVCWTCYRQPFPDDFDRYIYETLVRVRTEPIETIYPSVKHANPRMEASAVLDSPQHLAQLEPLYAIRPIYISFIQAATRTGVPVRSAINAVSSVALFGIGVVLLFWTKSVWYSALLLVTPSVSALGRAGSPDAVSSLFVVGGLWAAARNRLFLGLLLLMVSIWIRTDNVLIVLAIVLWLAFQRRLLIFHAAILAVVAVSSVWFINNLSGNYGWLVLVRFSFIGGKYPAQIPAQLSLAEYSGVFVKSLATIGPQLAPWILLGTVALRRLQKGRDLLLPVLAAAAAHFVLFPSPEARYFSWVFLIVGIMFISAITQNSAADSGSGAMKRAALIPSFSQQV